MTSVNDTTTRLAQLSAERGDILSELTAEARQAGAGALLLIGSLGRCGGDAFSDLDLICVPGPYYTGVDLPRLFGDRVLAQLVVPRNAPIGGAYDGVCLDVAGVVLWLDFYTWPQATAQIPVDATAVFDNLGLPASDLEFIPLITRHSDPAAPKHPPGPETTLLRIAVGAKDLARNNRKRLADKLPDTQELPLDQIPALLHDLLAVIDTPELARAVAGTAALVDLADAYRTSEAAA